MKKRWVLLSVMCVLLFGVLGTGAIGAEDADEVITAEESSSYPPRSEWTDAKFFEFDASTGTIVKYSLDGPKDVVIPAEINGVAVRHIGEEAFYKWDNQLGKNIYEIQSVKFPEGLTTIGDCAFSSNQLTRVELPESLTTIGEWAFSSNQLTRVELPEGLTTIGEWAFSSNQLTRVELPEGLTSIEEGTFSVNQLMEVEFPASLTTIGEYAFAWNQLREVKLPEGLTSIGGEAFSNNQLRKVKFPDSLQKIEGWAFYWNQLTHVDLPDSLQKIGEAAFWVNQLTHVEFPESLTSIGWGAFSWNQLREVKFPESLERIEEKAFRENQLTEVEVPKDCEVDPEAFDEGVKVNRRGEVLKPITLNTPSGDVEVLWGERLFQRPSTEYNDDLSYVSAALSAAAETEEGDEIVEAYQKLGFEEENIFLYSYPENSKNRSQYDWANNKGLAFSIAHRKFGDEVLLVFCLRGTTSGGDIWKDLNAGWVGTDFFGVRAHNGFYDLYEDVFKRGFVDYVKSHSDIIKARETEKLKILITGHSLGAAGANLLGASFNRRETNWADKSKIYVYTFATPNVYKRGIGGNDNLQKQGNENIFNIINVNDFVPKVPVRVINEWKKFGRQFHFKYTDLPAINPEPISSQHVMKHYLRAVYQNKFDDVWKKGTGCMYMVHCPVDVEVIDETGKVVARVVNNQIDETVTSVATYVEDDRKYFYLYEPEKYTVRVIGNDTGTMDMFVGMEDLESEEEIGRSEFKNVEVVKGKTMEGTVSKDSAPMEAPVKLYTLDKNGVPMKEIQSDGKEVENLFAEKVISDPNYSWTVTFNGALDASTVNAENFFIQDEDGNLLSGIQPTVVDGTKVRFVNNTTFEKNKVYYLVVKKEVRGQGNTKLKKTVILKFRVE